MKYLIVSLLTFLLFSCQTNIDDDMSLDPDSFEVYSSTINHLAEEEMITIIEKNDEYSTIKLGEDQIRENTILRLREVNFGNVNQRIIDALNNNQIDHLEEILLNLSTQTRARQEEILSGFISNSNVYTAEQHHYIDPFISKFVNVENYESAMILARNFESEIMTSNLTQEDKILLIQFSASSLALTEFAQKGGIEEMRNKIAEDLGIDNQNGRINGACNVDWRMVWLGGVAAGVVGAYTGATAGATAGTVVFPVVGTVSGVVGGGVVGFASGFVSGTLTGIGVSLLGTCFRGSRGKCGTPGNPPCIHDNKNLEMTGRTEAACNQMRAMGFTEFQLPSVCRQNIVYRLFY